MTNTELPIGYRDFLLELAALSKEPRVWNKQLGIGQEPEDIAFMIHGETWINLGCYTVEQDVTTGESVLWHTYADGPEGYQALEFDEQVESDGGWPLEDDEDHYSHHGLDRLTWSLFNTLDQALNGFLDENHAEDFCKRLDPEFSSAVREKLIEKLTPLKKLNCACGEFASNQIIELENQIDTDK